MQVVSELMGVISLTDRVSKGRSYPLRGGGSYFLWRGSKLSFVKQDWWQSCKRGAECAGRDIGNSPGSTTLPGSSETAPCQAQSQPELQERSSGSSENWLPWEGCQGSKKKTALDSGQGDFCLVPAFRSKTSQKTTPFPESLLGESQQQQAVTLLFADVRRKNNRNIKAAQFTVFSSRAWHLVGALDKATCWLL